MKTINYNINFFKSAISTLIKGIDSAGHFQDFRVSKCWRFLFSCQKYPMSGGYFHPCNSGLTDLHGPWLYWEC